jgi:transcriptional regulator with XRE-family HTH domain
MVSMKTSYRDLDYAYGTAMQKLRNVIGLTQAGLADRLGVSWRTVAGWEAGSSYPRAEHLKELIALAVQQQAFAIGHEAEEIRVLWKVAHQKMLLDEDWLSALLPERSSPLGQQAQGLHVEPEPVEETMTTAQVTEQEPTGRDLQTADQTCDARYRVGASPRIGARHDPYSGRPQPFGVVPTAPAPRVDWGDAQAVPICYGREQELVQLTQWVIQERCRMVSVLGRAGIGKSILSVSTMYRAAEHFEVVIFRSLRDSLSCEALLDDCLQVLSYPQKLRTVPANLEQRISLLLSHLHTTRVLVVLDNLESLLHEGDFRPGFEGYGQLLHLVAETDHQSCLLFTSREEPAELRTLSDQSSLVRPLHLTGLDAIACQPQGQSHQPLLAAGTTGAPPPWPEGSFPQTLAETNADQSQRSPVVGAEQPQGISRSEISDQTITEKSLHHRDGISAEHASHSPYPETDKTRGRRKWPMPILIALVILTIIGSAGTLFFQTREQALKTAAAQAYPEYLSGNGTLAFFDPLNQEGRWHNGSEALGGLCQFSGGAYHVRDPHVGFFAWCLADGTFGNFALEVQLTITQGDCGGMTFRDDSNGRYYKFTICQDGRYRVSKFMGNNNPTILQDSDSSAIRTGLGQQNKIAIMASGSTMIFYVNERQIDQEQDSSYTPGKIALIASPYSSYDGHATDAAYSNAKLWIL